MTFPLFFWSVELTNRNGNSVSSHILVTAANDAALAIQPSPLRAVQVTDKWPRSKDLAKFAASLLPATLPDPSYLIPADTDRDDINLERDNPIILAIATGEVIEDPTTEGGTTYIYHMEATNEDSVVLFFRPDLTVAIHDKTFSVADTPDKPGLVALSSYAAPEGEPQVIEPDGEFPDVFDGDTVEAFFWENINPYLNDGFLEDGDLDGEEMAFIRGSQDQLEADTTLLVEAWMRATNIDENKLISIGYSSLSDHGQAGLSNEDCEQFDNAPQALYEALGVVFEENTFTGYRSEYNDGAYDRRSGYDFYPHSLQIEVGGQRLTGHERIASIRNQIPAARKWLEEHGFEQAKIDQILSGDRAKAAE